MRRTSLARMVILAGATTLAGAAPSRAQDTLAPLDLGFDRSRRTVAPGVEYVHLVSEGVSGRAPLSAHLLRVDLGRNRIELALALDQVLGQETPSSLAARSGALAAVNGGFSVSNDPWVLVHGDPNGFVVVAGQVVSEPAPGRAALGFCDGPGRQSIRTLEPALRVTVAGGGASEAAGLNRAMDHDDLVVYTPAWSRTTVTPRGTLEAVVRRGRVVAVSRGGGAAIPDDGLVVAAVGGREAWLGALAVGAPVGVSMDVREADTGHTLEVDGCSFTSAGPVVAVDGRPRIGLAGPAYRSGFVHDRHPRTAVGLDAAGTTLWLAVVDGRQEHSAGMTLAEVASFLLEEGASMVYNLDGGGSSAMVLEGRLMNQPSDGRERRRTDVLLVRPLGR